MKLTFGLIGLVGVLSCVAFAQRPNEFNRSAQGRRGPEFPQELKDVFEKGKTIRFSGVRTVTVVKAGKIETHEEYVTKDGPNLRIEFSKRSPYAGQVIVETKEGRRHYFPDQNEIRVYPSFGKRQFEGNRGNFRPRKDAPPHMDSSNGGVIAGLHCTKFQLSDKDNNPIFQLFAEPKSGMIAKRVFFDGTGNIAGSYEFTKIDLNPRIQKGAFTIFRKNAKVIHPIDELKRQAGIHGLPAFFLRNASNYKMEGVSIRDVKGAKVIVQNYAKDDSRVTLFITKASLSPSDLKRFNRGELGTYVWVLNGVTLVLIGDQSEDRLRALSGQVSD